jgi:hypothetical protein
MTTVITIAALMMLMVTGIFSIINENELIMKQINDNKAKYNNIESAFLLYSKDSLFKRNLNLDGSFTLYDSVNSSRMIFSTEQWGLYELVAIECTNGYPRSKRLIGNKFPFKEDGSLYYACSNNGLSLTGKSVLEGKLFVPTQGISTKQLKSEFFRGKKPDKRKIVMLPGTMMPAPRMEIRAYTDSLFEVGICDSMVIVGDRLYIDCHTQIEDHTIIIANSVTVGKGADLCAQIFAADTIILENGVLMRYPSGLFINRKNPARYMEIGNGCTVNGYTIVDGAGDCNIRYPNYNLKNGAVVRGLVYVNGISKMAGIVNGAVVLNNSTLFLENEYYSHTLHNFVLLENKDLAYPTWLETDYGKKEVAWLN